MASNNILSFTEEEQKALHWDGIVAVCTGKFKNLTEAKHHLGNMLILKKSGLHGDLLTAVERSPELTEFYVAMHSGKKWGDIWYDETLEEMHRTKKELSKIYVDLALQPEGRWRLGAKKVQLEERLVQLKTELGMSQD
jgi:hypothetical protein